MSDAQNSPSKSNHSNTLTKQRVQDDELSLDTRLAAQAILNDEVIGRTTETVTLRTFTGDRMAESPSGHAHHRIPSSMFHTRDYPCAHEDSAAREHGRYSTCFRVAGIEAWRSLGVERMSS